MAKRRQNFQNIAWFWDIYKRKLLDMDPPYQRRSVWNQQYQESFIDTILLDYPAPAIFLFSRIDDEGTTSYEVVDGKQRLTTVFEFLGGSLTVGDQSAIDRHRGKYFSDLPEDDRVAIYEYDFPVEYLPTNNEEVINNIFDRLNRNTAKLTQQELRHARYSGLFITRAEELAEWMGKVLDPPFPRIYSSSRKQMKDVEITAQLMLYLEIGHRRQSVIEMDAAFSERDAAWDREEEITARFKEVVQFFASMLAVQPDGEDIPRSRFMNQADFYSLFAAIAELQKDGKLPTPIDATQRIVRFTRDLADENDGKDTPIARVKAEYIAAAISGSHDTSQRATRISITKHVLLGKPLETWERPQQ